MAFPRPLASVLTGATLSQLRTWAEKGLVVPEINPKRPPLYSFRDLVALRAMVALRATTSLQRISKAFANLDVFDLTEHPATYRFGTDGSTVWVGLPGDDQAMDLVRQPGQFTLMGFDDIARAFQNFRDDEVVDFYHPDTHVSVRPQRLGGWPTITGTRVPYDTVANLVDGETVTPDDVADYYPDVSPEAAASAVAFDARVRAVRAA
ncbi:MAG: DUF433 domain-containing protein [Micrococcales bacterium]|nr:DUF433 domain-containing protein [Micrococcales bacterium]